MYNHNGIWVVSGRSVVIESSRGVREVLVMQIEGLEVERISKCYRLVTQRTPSRETPPSPNLRLVTTCLSAQHLGGCRSVKDSFNPSVKV